MYQVDSTWIVWSGLFIWSFFSRVYTLRIRKEGEVDIRGELNKRSQKFIHSEIAINFKSKYFSIYWDYWVAKCISLVSVYEQDNCSKIYWIFSMCKFMWVCVGGESHLRVFSCKSHHFRDFFNMYIVYYIKLSNSKNYKEKDKHDILHRHGRKNYHFDDFFTPAVRSFIFIFFRPYTVAG